VTLQAHLGAVTRAEHAALYRQAVTLIARMQQRGRDLTSDRYLPYGIAFDVEKLSWELQFFVKHFLEAYRGAVITPARREALGVELQRVAEELAAEPRVFCHRDYHSRNLMLHAGQLYIIDFQDARMGPDTYDLVSLLRDSYMDFSEREVDELIAFFLALRGVGADRRGADMEAGLFRRRFDLMALQRNLKALGTFGFQTTTRANPVYIQYIPRTLAYVRNNMERDARFGRLREILSAHVDELR
jgi:N-acetylmuramate 1-kinase